MTRVALDLDPALAEARRDPSLDVPADVVHEHVADLRDRLAERGVRLQLLADEAQHGSRRRRAEVVRDRLDIRGLPAARQPAPVATTAVDLRDEDEAGVPEQRPRVAGRDHVGSGHAVSARYDEPLDRLRPEAGPKPLERVLDLRTVVAGDDIGGLQLGRGHPATLDHRSDRTVNRRPSDSTTMRPFSSVRSVSSRGTASSAAIVSGRGWS